MYKIGILGIVAAILSLIIRKDKPELALILSITTGTIIFFCCISQLSAAFEFLRDTVGQLPVDATYLKQLFKMLGIAYAAEFSSNLCKESGHAAIAGQIELFAKISIVAISIPTLSLLIKLMETMI